MATNTTNYNLVKPDGEEFYDVTVQNGNMDIIDEEIKNVNEKVELETTNITNISNNLSNHINNQDNPHNVTLEQLNGLSKENIGIINVMWYGAKIDGSDTASYIQDAIDAANSLGILNVFIPAGTYILEASISIPSYITLYGVGKGTILKRKIGFTNNPLITNAVNATRITIHSLYVDGNNSDTTTTRNDFDFISATDLSIYDIMFGNSYGSAVRIATCTDVNINNCNFANITGTTGNPGEGIYVNGSSDINITNCTFNTLTDHAIYLDGTTTLTSGVNVSNCSANNTGTASTASASYNIFQNCKGINFSNCASINCSMGFTIQDSSNGTYCPSDITINGCAVESPATHGITLNRNIIGTTPMFVTISGCVIYRAGRGAGVGVVAHGINAYNIEGYTITGNLIHYSNRNGIQLTGCVNGTISSNSILDNNISNTETWASIQCNQADASHPTKFLVINGNILQRAASGSQKYGVIFSDNPDRVCMVGNIMYYNASGAYTGTVTNSIIQNNLTT
jgi:hypothetical protein